MTLSVRVPVAPTIVLGKQQMNNQSQQCQQGQIEKLFRQSYELGE